METKREETKAVNGRQMEMETMQNVFFKMYIHMYTSQSYNLQHGYSSIVSLPLRRRRGPNGLLISAFHSLCNGRTNTLNTRLTFISVHCRPSRQIFRQFLLHSQLHGNISSTTPVLVVLGNCGLVPTDYCTRGIQARVTRRLQFFNYPPCWVTVLVWQKL